MSQTTSLILHELMMVPERWSDTGDGFISNGYYKISLDGRSYGMGSAVYQCTGDEGSMLASAVEKWKKESGWEEKKVVSSPSVNEKRNARMTPETYSRKAYENFAFSVRSHFRSFRVHSDAGVLSAGIGKAIEDLDTALRPIEAIEGRKRNQEGGQSDSISGA